MSSPGGVQRLLREPLVGATPAQAPCDGQSVAEVSGGESTRLAQKSGGNLLVGYTYEFRGRLFAAGNLVQKRRESIPLGIVALRIRRIAIERNRNLHQQAAIVIQFDLGAMHLAHRSDQTQAEAGAFGRAVFVEA